MMTTLETVLICVAGLETVVTAVWVTRERRRMNRLLMIVAVLVQGNERRAQEIEAMLDAIGVWKNAR